MEQCEKCGAFLFEGRTVGSFSTKPHRCPPLWYVWDQDEWEDRQAYPDGNGHPIYARDAQEAVETRCEQCFSDYDYEVDAYKWVVVKALPFPGFDNPEWFEMETMTVPEHRATRIEA